MPNNATIPLGAWTSKAHAASAIARATTDLQARLDAALADNARLQAQHQRDQATIHAMQTRHIGAAIRRAERAHTARPTWRDRLPEAAVAAGAAGVATVVGLIVGWMRCPS